MRSVFDHTLSGGEAARELLCLKQGNLSTYDYAIKFPTLSASCDWDNHTLFDVFYHGLSENVKDDLPSWELPSDLDAVMDLVGCTDAYLRSWQREVPRITPGMWLIVFFSGTLFATWTYPSSSILALSRGMWVTSGDSGLFLQWTEWTFLSEMPA